MNVVRRSATGAVAAAAIVLAGPALAANAASRPHHFETLTSIISAKVQACRVPTQASKPVTIKIRIDATKASGKVNGIAQASHDGTASGKQWTSGWVREGHRSAVGTIHVPRGAGWALQAGLGTGAMGNGGDFTTASIRTCR
ncbi:MAG: hypothetical protein JOZ82_06620 [Marmoricola sp.]|nr:hypothetical protein [Marmoricola sp.]